jgi:hypothetical protein
LRATPAYVMYEAGSVTGGASGSGRQAGP